MKSLLSKPFYVLTPYWDAKTNLANHLVFWGVYTSDKPIILCTVDKIHIKRDAVHRFVTIGVKQPNVFQFRVAKTPEIQINFVNLEQKVQKKTNKSVLNTINFCLEDTDHKGFNLNGETLTLILQVLKMWWKNNLPTQWGYKEPFGSIKV